MAYNGGGNKRMCVGMDLDRNNDDSFGEEPRRKRPDARPNHILLYSIINPAYPITVDVIYTISSPHGQVQRIVIFKKNGVQSMVEFESVESATRAKEALQGADIYSGCCTLKIEYAKPERLNVFKNNQESWDYTLKDEGSPQQQRSVPLLQSPPFPRGPLQPYADSDRRPLPPMERNFYRDYQDDSNGGMPNVEYGDGRMNQGPRFGMRGMPPHHQSFPSSHHDGGGNNGSVMMVYGLDPDNINANKLFNLLCLYGNIARIKFLKTKKGTAMVQMGDAHSVERCIQNLKNVTVNEHTMTLAFSKQTFLSEVINPYPLADKTPSFMDYTGSKNNRFLSAASSYKNRIQPPSRIIHFYNTPPDVTEEQLRQVFEDHDLVPPAQISKFPLKSERSSSGLMEFSSISQAVLAIMGCNHATIMQPGAKFPFLMKLCFSSAYSIGPSIGRRSSSEDKGIQDGKSAAR